MSPLAKRLMELVLERNVAHGGYPVLRWMMDNIFVWTDPAGNIKLDKDKSTEKIDGRWRRLWRWTGRCGMAECGERV